MLKVLRAPRQHAIHRQMEQQLKLWCSVCSRILSVQPETLTESEDHQSHVGNATTAGTSLLLFLDAMLAYAVAVQLLNAYSL